jgi:hypothetical protein
MLIQRYQIVLRQFVDHSEDVVSGEVVRRKHLGLDLFRPHRVPALVVAEVPKPDEQ